MKKFYLLLSFTFLFTLTFISCKNSSQHIPLAAKEIHEDEENEGYDGPAERDAQEFEQTKDPSLGYVPYTRLTDAIAETEQSKRNLSGLNSPFTVLWQERGPIYDSVGPSNGNTRGGNGYTSGRMAAILIDTLNDPSGNTVIAGGVAGGVWKCTNFLSSIPNWKLVNDYYANMAISSLCQDPTNPSVIYFSTGEATSNADAHFGAGIWKSVDKGQTFIQLPSTINFIRNWKLACDASGNVYLAARTTATPAVQTAGLLRSKDGGATWVNITPTAQGTATATATCTDIEISSNGKLYASFGYLGTTVKPYVTLDPANVTQATGWVLGTGIRTSAVAAVRMEFACRADTVYAVTVNTAYNSDSCYKSIDGGLTFTKQNTAVMPAGVLNTQGWYNLTLNINPSNSSELMCGGLDAYRSINNGATWTRVTFWVTTSPYVHADHHNMQWWNKGSESRMVIGCDGGIFFSKDGGITWNDKNRNLNLKQFYCASIHPAAGSPYILAGAQDNGCHQLKNPGLSYSTEVTGGDGMYTYINQLDPTVQFGSYTGNQYRRSLDGGATWSQVNLSTAGLFTNPFDYDDAQNIMYAADNANSMRRWPNANTTTTSTVLTVSQLSGGQAGAVKTSLNIPNRVYLGGTTGKVVKLDNANATPVATDITGAGFPGGGNIHCINTGTTDNNMVVCFSNFGVNNVWTTTDGGTTWTAIDGNLPDMPVWWAMYDPSNNSRMMIATETGVWTTDNINGASTVWTASPGFPTTRVSMLRMRASDRTVVAATFGRGVWTGIFSASTTPEISFINSFSIATEETAGTTGCRSYKDYVVNVGIINTPTGDATVTYKILGGTAVQGVDYDITTNGSFSSPSLTHTFANGVLSIQPVTIRIYDDAEVESTEQFTLGFTISGATNAVAGAIPVHTFTINDNDRFPVPFGTNSYAIGTYNIDLTALNTPFDGTKLKHRLQVLYTADELRAAGISIGGAINSVTLRVKTKNTVRPFTGFTVSIGNTSSTNLNTGFVTEGLTTLYSGNYNTLVGNNTFTFTNPYIWDGISNIAIQYCYDMSAYGTPDNLIDIVEGSAAPLGTGTRGSSYSNYTTSGAAGCVLPAAFVSDPRATVSFNATFGDPVATALGSTKTENLGANNDLFYYTSTGQILARVLNLSTQNYGCTQVLIDRAGTGVSQFWNSNPANYLMNKTFQVIPTTNNPAGKNEVTFYFTKAEKEGWEAATGRLWDSIQIVKLPSRINNVTPLNAQPDGAGTIQVINAVKRTFGPDYYTLSAIFENGFSGFGFGIPGRMNTILTLTGAIDQNNVDIDLNWTTSAEVNSTVFEVEKSYDNVTFHKIGTVAAAGNKFTPSSYPFVDHENVQNNYYRIKMLHSDGYILYSNTLIIKKDNAPQRIFVLNNPFTTQIGIRFSVLPTGPIVFSLYDAAGKLVKRYSPTAGSIQYNFSTYDIFTSGVYMLKISTGAQTFSTRLLKL